MSELDPTAALATLLGQLPALPRTERDAAITRILPLLADARIPLTPRIAAAARVLHFTPDRKRPVRRVVGALTAGVSSKRAIDRMRQVQNQIERCAALDDLIAARELRVKMSCPRCKIKLPRIEMVKHLWHEHRLILHKRETRTTSRTAAELRAAFAATGEPEPLDQFAELHGTAGLRRWMADDRVPAEELSPLLAAATEHAAGLCPGCFAELPTAIEPLPLPLDLANGRLAGEGYAVRVGGNAWIRTIAVSLPDSPTTHTDISLAPRLIATLAASVVVLFSLVLTVPLVGVVAGVLTYLAVRFAQSRQSNGDDAVNVAWSRLAPGLAEHKHAARFLTRLCLASLGRGNSEQRVKVLVAIAARAQSRAEESDAELQLLAAVGVLQIEDATRFGRDAIAGIASLAALGFRGERTADVAECVVGAYLSRERTDGELGRLRVLLLAAAFEAGLVPRDLFDIWAAAPNLKRAMTQEPTHRLALLYGLWRLRDSHPWHSVGHGDTVFDLARKLPRDAADLLARFPDVLLWHRPERAVEDLIGPVLICARGVAIAGQLVADPATEVQLEAGGRALMFGRHRIEARGPLPADFPESVRRWLQFRAEWLPTLGEGYLAAGSPDVSRRVLAPFCRRCSACRTVSAVGCGAVGRAVVVSTE